VVTARENGHRVDARRFDRFRELRLVEINADVWHVAWRVKIEMDPPLRKP
jgi:hypothetical protein